MHSSEKVSLFEKFDSLVGPSEVLSRRDRRNEDDLSGRKFFIYCFAF